MRAYQKQWRWGITITLLSMATAFGLWKTWPRERLLLKRSTPIAAPWNVSNNEVWISDHEIAAADIDYTNLGASGNLPASMVYTDFRAGKTRRVPLKHLQIDERTHLLPSPDGRWALCYDGRSNLKQAIAVEVQTGRRYSWTVGGDGYHYGQDWLSDSHRWLEYTTVGQGYLTIHSVDEPGKNVRLTVPKSMPSQPFVDVVTAAEHLLIIDQHLDDTDDQTPPQGAGLEVYEYRLLPDMAYLRTLHVASPPGVKTLGALVSPDGDHIVWACSQSYVSPLTVWLHRWVKRVPAEPQECLGLWVSRLDGSQMHEAGHIRLSPEDETPGDENSARILPINWLPDSKRFSFVYKDALYTTSLD